MRWRTCPFEEVAAAVPATGRVLDLGCGHGLFALLLQSSSPGREVHGSDIDGRKVAAARIAATRLGLPVTFHHATDPLVEGAWDAITIVDVLYLLPRTDSLRLLSAAAAALRPGGRIIVKEIALRPRWKYRLAVLQERLATGILGITEGAGVAFVGPPDIRGALEAAGLNVTERRVDRWYPHPHLLMVGTARQEVVG